MQEILKLIIATAVLFLGVPIGNILRNKTKEEIEEGAKWLKLIVFVSLIIGLVGLFVQNDWLMFSFFFIAIVTSRSLVVKKFRKKK